MDVMNTHEARDGKEEWAKQHDRRNPFEETPQDDEDENGSRQKPGPAAGDTAL